MFRSKNVAENTEFGGMIVLYELDLESFCKMEVEKIDVTPEPAEGEEVSEDRERVYEERKILVVDETK